MDETIRGHGEPGQVVTTEVCPLCCSRHHPQEPHDRNSLAYRVKFTIRYGRLPTWQDAMSHCTPLVRELFLRCLREYYRQYNKKMPRELR